MMTYTEMNANTLFSVSQVGDEIINNAMLDSATKKITCDKNIGDGCSYIFELPENMTVAYSDITFKKPIVFKEKAQDYFGACLVLSGSLDLSVSSNKTPLTIDKDEALFFVCHDAELAFHYNPNNTKYLNFHVPKSMMNTLLEKEATDFNKNSFFTVVITARIVQIIDEIFRSELCNSAKSLYLQAKVMELLALLYQNIDCTKNACHDMPSRDVDCILQAAKIIEENMTAPPSLIELSRKIGINDSKLKKNFKQVYGNTVYGYLNDKRMIKASELLLEGQMTIKEVSNQVGYKHVGYFSKIFKERFSCSPKHYKKERLSN